MDIQHLQDMANVKLLARPRPPTFELGATSWQWQQPLAVWVAAANSFEVLPFSYLLLHTACDT